MSENLARHFLLRDDVVFLNHGSFGACPREVFEAYQNWQLELERQPVAFLGRDLTDRMRLPRVALAAELGTEADNIVGLVNATEGLNIVAQSLELQPRDEIVTTSHEYSAIEKTWTYLARRTGARIVVAKVPMPLVSEAAFTDAIVGAFTDRTRVLFLSHITSPTAFVLPIGPSIREAKARGVWTVIDGAHTPGHIPLNLDAMDVDFYAGDCHKWLLTPKGSAFLYVRPELQRLINPLVISHGWTDDFKRPGAKGAFGNSPFIDELEVQGTRDPAAWLTVPAALAFRAQHGWAGVATHCQMLAQDTAHRLAQLTGLPPFSTPEFCAPQMVAMPIPHVDDPVEFQARLMDRHRIEIPVFKWQEHTIVRLSVQGYNSKAQMDFLIEALTDMLHLEASARLALKHG